MTEVFDGFLVAPPVVLFLPTQLPMTLSLVEDLVTRELVGVTRSLVEVFVVTRDVDEGGVALGRSFTDDLFTRSLLTRPLVTRLLVGRVIGLD